MIIDSYHGIFAQPLVCFHDVVCNCFNCRFHTCVLNTFLAMKTPAIIGPHCLNRGGVLAQCGIHEDRNYDKPLNSQKQPMSPNIQAEYNEGDLIEVKVLLTTHHKGHMELSVCPIENSVPMEVPTERCFAKNKLEFVSDELYDAPIDANYPERAYIAPAGIANPEGSSLIPANYTLRFRLPMGVSGDLVLLQWYYLTANSCKHEGYADYPFPEAWGGETKL
jgi:hypothetical protein